MRTCLFLFCCLFSVATSKDNGFDDKTADWLTKWTSEMYDTLLRDSDLEEHSLVSPKRDLTLYRTGMDWDDKQPSNGEAEAQIDSSYLVKRQNGGKFRYDPAIVLMGLGKKKSIYDPALHFMGLGKRQFTYDPAFKYIGLGKRKYRFDPALMYMGLGKRDIISNSVYRSMGKRSLTSLSRHITDSPLSLFTEMAQTVSKPHVILDTAENMTTNAFAQVLKPKRSVFTKEDFISNQVLKSDNVRNANENVSISSVPSNDDFTEKRPKSGKSYLFGDSAKYSALKEIHEHDLGSSSKLTGRNFEEFSENSTPNDSDLRISFKPSLISIKVDKQTKNLIPSELSYDSSQKFTGLGKRGKNCGCSSSNFDYVLKRMENRKRDEDDFTSKRQMYDPAFYYMGLGKRNNVDAFSKRQAYVDGLLYMGQGKQKDAAVKSERVPIYYAFTNKGQEKLKNADMNSKTKSTLTKIRQGEPSPRDVTSKRQSYDPAFQYMGLGKREDDAVTSKRLPMYYAITKKGQEKLKNADISSKTESTLKNVKLGETSPRDISSKRQSLDPAFQYMGLGKRKDADVIIKRQTYDPAFQYMGLGKREDADGIIKRQSFDPAFQYMGLGKREDADDIIKRQSYDPAFQYMGLGKRENADVFIKRQSYDPAFQYMGLGKRSDADIFTKRQSYDPAFQYMGLGKREDADVTIKKQSYDPSFQYMGLGKRENVHSISKRQSYDPAFQYMGLGKREDVVDPNKRVSHDPAFQYMGLGKRINTDDVTSKKQGGNSGFKKKGTVVRENSRRFPSANAPPLRFRNTGTRRISRTRREGVFDPALHYMGLGKRKAYGIGNLSPNRGIVLSSKPSHAFENPLGSERKLELLDSSLFESKRVKRHIMKFPKEDDTDNTVRKPFIDRAENNTDYPTTKKCLNQAPRKKRALLDDKEVAYGFEVDSRDLNSAEPREDHSTYNPGWDFVGLGKRSINRSDTSISILTKCYFLLAKITEALEDFQFNVKKKIEMAINPYTFAHKANPFFTLG